MRKKEVVQMDNEDAGWVPRPHPESVLFTRQRTRSGAQVLTGSARGKTCWVKDDGTYVIRAADGTYSTGRWSE